MRAMIDGEEFVYDDESKFVKIKGDVEYFKIDEEVFVHYFNCDASPSRENRTSNFKCSGILRDDVFAVPLNKFKQNPCKYVTWNAKLTNADEFTKSCSYIDLFKNSLFKI